MTASPYTSEHPLWSVGVERDMLVDSMFATIYCDSAKGGCGYTERAVFRGRSGKCPVCGKAAIGVSAFNQRNAIVADMTERFALSLFSHAINTVANLSGKFFVKRNVVCPQLELRGATSADMAILNSDIEGPVPARSIECIFEIKMSIIWNWAEDDKSKPLADYDAHAGRPSIYRTDSILKAIGKAAITRSCQGSERIPFIVVSNTPPPPNYRDKVDGTVRAGLIQKWISLTPNPLVVEPNRSPGKRNPKQTAGFLRIDSVSELQELLSTVLTSEWQYVGAMVEAKRIGEIIKSLDLSRAPEQIGYEFVRRLPEATALFDL
jgi:hypothetical protein